MDCYFSSCLQMGTAYPGTSSLCSLGCRFLWLMASYPLGSFGGFFRKMVETEPATFAVAVSTPYHTAAFTHCFCHSKWRPEMEQCQLCNIYRVGMGHMAASVRKLNWIEFIHRGRGCTQVKICNYTPQEAAVTSGVPAAGHSMAQDLAYCPHCQ